MKNLIQDKPRISRLCCNFFEKLSEVYCPATETQQENLLTVHLPFLIQNMYMQAQSSQKPEYFSVYYLTITQLLQSSCRNSNQLVYEFMIEIL